MDLQVDGFAAYEAFLVLTESVPSGLNFDTSIEPLQQLIAIFELDLVRHDLETTSTISEFTYFCSYAGV